MYPMERLEPRDALSVFGKEILMPLKQFNWGVFWAVLAALIAWQLIHSHFPNLFGR